MSEVISYKLEHFEGPLDLLLHLIDREKINIYDIPIAQITDQYLSYISTMDAVDLSAMSDFLVMAATLLEIKSVMLLPKEVDPETGEEIDPRSELVERLIEHRRYKIMAQELAVMEKDAARQLYREASLPPEVAGYIPPPDLDTLLKDITLTRLKAVFEQAVRIREDRIDPVRSRFGTIQKEKVSLKEKLDYLMRFSEERKQFSFRELLSASSRSEMVVTFLAVLELTKVGKFKLRQDDLNDDIMIETASAQENGELDLSGLEDFDK